IGLGAWRLTRKWPAKPQPAQAFQGKNIVAGGPAQGLLLVWSLSLPLALRPRRTCSTQACSGEMPRTMPVTWTRRLSTYEPGGCGFEAGIGRPVDPCRANLLLATQRRCPAFLP